MEYSDQENLNWWVSLTKDDQLYLLEKMCEKMTSGFAHGFAQSLMKMYKFGHTFTAKQIASIRKWDN